jgi:hypothetical protein
MSDAALLAFVTYVVGTFVLYWVIRLAVRHAMEDVHEARSRSRRVITVEEPEQPSDQ